MEKVKMDIKKHKNSIDGIKISVEDKDKEIAWAYLYILTNDRHDDPYGFLENVYVEKEYRKQGIGKELINKIIEEAKSNNCYKIIATSRHSKPKVHDLYEHFGFKNHGLEFRMDLKKSSILQRD